MSTKPQLAVWIPEPDEPYSAGAMLASLRLNRGRRLQVVSPEAAKHFICFENKIPFPEKLFAMVTEAAGLYPDAIHWVKNGAGFQVCPASGNLEPLLRKYFKHGNYTSLQRQLNMYGWKKQAHGPHKGAFFNPDFHRHLVTHQDIESIPRRAPPAQNKPEFISKALGSSSEQAVIQGKANVTCTQVQAVANLPRSDTGDSHKRPPSSSSFGCGDTVISATARPDVGCNALAAMDSFALFESTADVLTALDHQDGDWHNQPCLTTPTTIAGSSSCITSDSAFWASDHDSITPRVQNPRVKIRVLQRVEHSAVTAPKRGTARASFLPGSSLVGDDVKGTGKRPVWISPTYLVGGGGIDEIMGDPPTLLPVAEEMPGDGKVVDKRLTANCPVWISPNFSPGYARGVVDENEEPPYTKSHAFGVRIPVTPIHVRKRPIEEIVSEDTLYCSSMMPTPLSLSRQESSSSFLAPFVGEMGNLSRALDMACTDHASCDSNNEMSFNSNPIKCEPFELHYMKPGGTISPVKSDCTEGVRRHVHSRDIACTDYNSGDNQMSICCPIKCEPLLPESLVDCAAAAWGPVKVESIEEYIATV